MQKQQVIIVGGGPAGSSLGCYLSLLGYKNMIIERANYPRAHVGESMVTSTTRNFRDIGSMNPLGQPAQLPRNGSSECY